MDQTEQQNQFAVAEQPPGAVTNLPLPISYTPPPPCPASIIKAKVAVMKAVHGVGQTGRNKFHQYDYASSADVLKAVREAMVENGLALEIWPVEVSKDDDKNMRVKFMLQWQHESGDVSEPLPWWGVANDRDKSGTTGDKWFNKCATAAEKYFFLKQFHIPSEKDFDPDEGNAHTDGKGDKPTAKGKPAAKKVAPKAKAPAAQSAKATEAKGPTEADTKKAMEWVNGFVERMEVAPTLPALNEMWDSNEGALTKLKTRHKSEYDHAYKVYTGRKVVLRTAEGNPLAAE